MRLNNITKIEVFDGQYGRVRARLYNEDNMQVDEFYGTYPTVMETIKLNYDIPDSVRIHNHTNRSDAHE